MKFQRGARTPSFCKTVPDALTQENGENNSMRRVFKKNMILLVIPSFIISCILTQALIIRMLS